MDTNPQTTQTTQTAPPTTPASTPGAGVPPVAPLQDAATAQQDAVKVAIEKELAAARAQLAQVAKEKQDKEREELTKKGEFEKVLAQMTAEKAALESRLAESNIEQRVTQELVAAGCNPEQLEIMLSAILSSRNKLAPKYADGTVSGAKEAVDAAKKSMPQAFAKSDASGGFSHRSPSGTAPNNQMDEARKIAERLGVAKKNDKK